MAKDPADTVGVELSMEKLVREKVELFISMELKLFTYNAVPSDV
jgi:hypothetical protein|tara:strand:- start:283 stop:414 length:132 start_codon:yes stop_codon:yes gene_type:complete